MVFTDQLSLRAANPYFPVSCVIIRFGYIAMSSIAWFGKYHRKSDRIFACKTVEHEDMKKLSITFPKDHVFQVVLRY